ncbi:hypothetical protein DL771_006650 [Monosporascus sp. 5C6A]|nr:hypothetical protein DL771_006650 [Monosporascus sp. 5C6A]
MATANNLPDGAPRVAPPPYEHAMNDTSYQDITPSQIHRKAGPATGGKFYHDDKRIPTIELWFSPDPTGLDLNEHPWCGHTMQVKCDDVPRLMREGFHWTAANTVQEDGSIEYERGKAIIRTIRTKFTMSRHLFLTDLQQPARWIAHLQFYATTPEVLSNFRLSHLSKRMIMLMTAWNVNSHMIYNFQAWKPQKAYNAIYDDIPLEGWWPWPGTGKLEVEKEKAGEAISVTAKTITFKVQQQSVAMDNQALHGQHNCQTLSAEKYEAPHYGGTCQI